MEVLVFELGGLRYALPAFAVSELVRAVTVVPLPKSPPAVEGIINVRGRVVPVLDVRVRFKLESKAVSPSDHLILARAGDRLVAIRVDRALGLVHLEPADIEEATSALPGTEYVMGVAKLPDGLVLIHDLQTFLSAAETAALVRAIATADSREEGTS
jgi:purine-binding chemotaxis protein CheW